ncbi:MAG: GNAT family N-acetyltransferase, partial [Spirochaetota bacterium]
NYAVKLEYDNKIIGYAGYHLLRKKPAFLRLAGNYTTIIHLISIAVSPSYQNSGFGSFLLNSILHHAIATGARYCYLEVRPSNHKAIIFYEKFGFSIIGVIENYYPEDNEDALVMGKELKLF